MNRNVDLTRGAARRPLPNSPRLRGPSPIGTCHLMVPVLRSYAVTRLYGRLVQGNPIERRHLLRRRPILKAAARRIAFHRHRRI